MAAPPAPNVGTKLEPLTERQLDFVNTQVSADFLHHFGSTRGYSLFCKVALAQGFKCREGSQSKASYATYLRNAKVNGGTLFDAMITAYNELDNFSKAAMAKQIHGGRKLKPVTFNVGCFRNYTVADLKEIAGLAGVKVDGNKAKICAQLQNAGVDPTLWGAAPDVTVAPGQTGTGLQAWKRYARRTKKRDAAVQTYAGANSYKPPYLPQGAAGLTPAEKAYLASLNEAGAGESQ